MELPSASEAALEVQQIYAEHGEVTEALNDIRSAISLGRPRYELAGRLTAFVTAVERHFGSEEGLMRAIGYQGANAHAAEHQRLLVQLRGLERDFVAGAIRQCGALALFVEVWTAQHMERQDKGLIDFLNAHASSAMVRRAFGSHSEPMAMRAGAAA
ncbi:MAG TPA: hemerythrin family protein [Bryobacteraceae bacterium]|nr:hemerythrin family protein [Bryobacteraceae bacterium]